MLKIAFLFLTIANVHHEDYWQDFFRSHEDQYSIYVHAKQSITEDSWFKPYEMQQKVPTSWSNTMRAQIAMLKQALSDPDNEKFVFVSETTIPLRDFDYIYEQLMGAYESMFSYTPNLHINRNVMLPNMIAAYRDFKPIPAKYQFKNSQWVVLNRKHAQIMVDDIHYIAIFSKHCCDQEHYPSTFLACKHLLHEVIPTDMTYVEWFAPMEIPPYRFSNLDDEKEVEMLKKAIKNGFLFARKIVKNCDVRPLDEWLEYRRKSEN